MNAQRVGASEEGEPGPARHEVAFGGRLQTEPCGRGWPGPTALTAVLGCAALSFGTGEDGGGPGSCPSRRFARLWSRRHLTP